MNPAVSDTGATEFLANLSIGTVVLVALALTLLRLALLRMSGPIRPGNTSEGSLARGLAEICESLIVAGVLVFLIIRPFFVQAFFIPSESMEDTLQGHDAYNPQTGVHHPDTIHDHIFVNKLIYRYSDPKRGDIVVFRAPASADAEDKYNHLPQKENVLIKRCIGIPGDTIEVKSGGMSDDAVYRNGVRLSEYHNSKLPYSIKEPMDPDRETQFSYAGPGHPFHLGPGQYWVMGDNRNDSNDSRYWGPLSRDRVIGKAEVIFWPLSRIRILH